jgi:hypothetical protein
MQYQTWKDSVSNSNYHASCTSHVYMKWLQLENTNDMTRMLLTTFSNATLTIDNVYHNCCIHDAVILCTLNMQPIWKRTHGELCTSNHCVDVVHSMCSIQFQRWQND